MKYEKQLLQETYGCRRKKKHWKEDREHKAPKK